jgi:cytochrome b6-f complex iron-sulfur subunit
MAKRTPEEILAQREAWLARKAAREAGEDISKQPPAEPGKDTSSPAELEAAEASAESETPQPAPEPAQPSTEAPAETLEPQKPKQKRTPEEIRAQREAFLAARAAKAAGEAPAPPAEKPAQAPPTPAAKPAESKPAQPPAAKAKPAAARRRPAPSPEPAGRMTRREFLNYAWLASIGLFSLQTIGLSLWFAFPNFKEGQFGGLFPIGEAAEVLPEVNAPPKPFTQGKFWLVNVDTEVDGEPRKGVLALYKICTHLGCLYEWVDMTNRFECPCHGSKFQLTGDYISGPARRNLDRFVIIARSPDGTEKISEEGKPLVLNGDETLTIDTGKRILGSSDITPA